MTKHSRKARSKKLRARRLSDVEHKHRNGSRPEDEDGAAPRNRTEMSCSSDRCLDHVGQSGMKGNHMKGTLNLNTHKLSIREGLEPDYSDVWEKDTSFWPPEQPAQIFEENGLTEVTVLGPGFSALVTVTTLTEFVQRMTRPL